MMVALHRMRDEGWTSRDALAEAERNGMRKFQFWMRDYADDYGDRMQKQKAQNVLHAPYVNDEDFDDRIGDGVRFAERGTFRVRKILRKVFR
jgi:hypothetical protein